MKKMVISMGIDFVIICLGIIMGLSMIQGLKKDDNEIHVTEYIEEAIENADDVYEANIKVEKSNRTIDDVDFMVYDVYVDGEWVTTVYDHVDAE